MLRPVAVVHSEDGFALGVAIFMLALLSMVGMASMMTSTTEVEIAASEKFYMQSFFQSESGFSIGGEVLKFVQEDRGMPPGADSIGSDGKPKAYSNSDNDSIKVIDTIFIQEPPDVVESPYGYVYWDVDDQSEDQLPCPDNMTATQCAAVRAAIGVSELDRWTDIQIVRHNTDVSPPAEVVLADIDIDKIGPKPLPGGGAEFGAKDQGVGVSTSMIMFNMDCIGRLYAGNPEQSVARHVMGFNLIE